MCADAANRIKAASVDGREGIEKGALDGLLLFFSGLLLGALNIRHIYVEREKALFE